MAGVWKHSTAATPAELLVLLALADWADEYGYCYPSQPAIASKARVSERQVQRVICKFTEVGELERQLGGHAVSAPGHRPGRTGLQHRNLYRLTCVPDEPRVDTMTSLRGAPRDDRPPPLGAPQGPTGAPRKGRHGRPERDDRDDRPIRKIRQEDPSGPDPSEGGRAGAAPRSAADDPDQPSGLVERVTKLAHFVIDQFGPDSIELTGALKDLCAFRGVKGYDSTIVRKAIESALWQRGHRARQG